MEEEIKNLDSKSAIEENDNKEEIAAKVAIEKQPKVNSILTNLDSIPAVSKLVSVAKLMEAGSHIGLSSKKWNPKMKPYIFKRKGQHDIIDVQKLLLGLQSAYDFLKSVAENNGQILYVSVKNKQIQSLFRKIAETLPVHFMAQRWLGGTLTNLKTINNSIEKLNRYTELQKTNGLSNYTKKEQLDIVKKMDKLTKFVGGIRNMKSLPNVLVIDDPVEGKNAVNEAKKLRIPVVALCNTNTNPDLIDYVVPCNNLSTRSVILLLTILCDAVAEAKKLPIKVAYKTDSEIQLVPVQKKIVRTSYERPSRS